MLATLWPHLPAKKGAAEKTTEMVIPGGLFLQAATGPTLAQVRRHLAPKVFGGLSTRMFSRSAAHSCRPSHPSFE